MYFLYEIHFSIKQLFYTYKSFETILIWSEEKLDFFANSLGSMYVVCHSYNNYGISSTFDTQKNIEC